MVFPFFIRVFDKEHLVDESLQGIAQTGILLVDGLSSKVVGNFALSGKFGAQTVASIPGIDEEMLTGLVGVFAEEVLEEVIHNEGGGLQVYVEPEVVIVAQFVGMEGECWIKHAEQTVELIHRNLPDAEEAEHMVDAVNIEVFSHLAETGFPPGETVAVHLLPVVCGESPVLTEHREIIGGSAGLAIEVEQLRRYPGVDRITGDADGNVALDSHTARVSVIAGSFHLFIEVILNPVHIIYIVLALFHQLFHLFRVVNGILAPAAEVGRAVEIAEHTERSIGGKPGGIVFYEFTERGRFHRLSADFAEQLFCEFRFGSVYALVVNLLKRVEFTGEVIEISLTVGVGQLAKLAYAQIHRMQGED